MTTDDRAARIAAIRERWGNQLGETWRVDPKERNRRDSLAHIVEKHGWVIGLNFIYSDAVAIAHAPEDVAWLLAEVERLGEQIAAMQALTDAEFIQPPQPGNMIIGYVRRVPKEGE